MEPAPSSARLKLRFAFFVAIVAFLWLGPFLKQALKVDTPLRGWTMFSGKAADICDVDFVVRLPDGGEERPSVESVITATALENRNREGSYYRLRNVEEIRRAGKKYCAVRRGIGLQVFARCGHWRKGWVRKMNGEEDLCQR